MANEAKRVRETEQLVSKQLMLNQSRLTPKSGDRLTRRQRELLSEIASIDEGIGYELSYLIEPNWWMDLYLDDQWDGPFPHIIAELAFPVEPEDPMNIAWDEWEQGRQYESNRDDNGSCKPSPTPIIREEREEDIPF